MQFGEKLKQLRTGKGMTQRELAERVNISPQAISRWENNEVQPSLEALELLADIFEVSMDDLFGKEKQTHETPEPEVIEKTVYINNPAPPQPVVLGVCEVCNSPITNKEELVRKGFGDYKQLVCRTCHCKQELHIAKQELKDALDGRRWGFGLGGAVGGLLWLLGIIFSITRSDPKILLSCGLLGTLSFMAIFCLFIGNSWLGDAGGALSRISFHAPGLIFEWSLDGFEWLIGMKILFWFIGVVVAVIGNILAFLFVLGFSPFFFPYDLVTGIRDIRVARAKTAEWEAKLKKQLVGSKNTRA